MTTEFCNSDPVISDNRFQTFEELLHEIDELLKLANVEAQPDPLIFSE